MLMDSHDFTLSYTIYIIKQTNLINTDFTWIIYYILLKTNSVSQGKEHLKLILCILIGVSPGYNCDDNNPCTPENIAAGRFYWPHSDPTKFVQCDAHGGCFVMPCGPGTVWDPVAYTCNSRLSLALLSSC